MKPSLLKRLGSVRGLIVSLVVFALVFALIYFVMGSFQTRSDENQFNMVRDAVVRAATTCYSIEGHFPQTIDYLKANYGLAFDADRYAVIYDAFASNIMPSIRVIAKEASGG